MLPVEINDEAVEISPLTAKENKRRAELEEVIERNFKGFVETGQALAEIRQSRLYRSTHTTFSGYCGDLWDVCGRRANQYISAATVIKNLQNGNNCSHFENPSPINPILLPANEAQARPLSKLEPDQQRTVWEDILQTAMEKDAKITAALVERIVAKHLNEEADREHGEIKHRIARSEAFTEEFKSSFDVFLASVDQARHEKWKRTSREAVLVFIDALRAQIMKGY